MTRRIKRASKTIGLAPGTLIHIGEKKTEEVKITVIDYDQDNFQEKRVKSIEECIPFKGTPTVTWINIDGIHRIDIIEKIGKYYEFHPLILEDILDTSQRPKIEDFENYIFVLLKMIYQDKKEEIQAEQVSLILGSNFVISFQEQEGDVFNHVRERIRNNKGRIRKTGPDYLAHTLLDAVVDNYFLIIEKLGEKVEGIEDNLVSSPTPKNLQTIQNLKRDIIFLRKSVWPLREVIGSLQRTESALIQEQTDIYIRNVYEHTIQVIDTIETLRDMVSGMLDIYLSSVSNRMNEVMKVLTIIATIFIPITFIAGIYGMNFNPQASRWNMPELNWPHGYMFAWAVMVCIAAIMIIYFKRKKWL